MAIKRSKDGLILRLAPWSGNGTFCFRGQAASRWRRENIHAPRLGPAGTKVPEPRPSAIPMNPQEHSRLALNRTRPPPGISPNPPGAFRIARSGVISSNGSLFPGRPGAPTCGDFPVCGGSLRARISCIPCQLHTCRAGGQNPFERSLYTGRAKRPPLTWHTDC